VKTSKKNEFELGVEVREWMIKTLSPFPVIARVWENDARYTRNAAEMTRRRRETKKPTVGELFNV
jgi:hypothetical protein